VWPTQVEPEELGQSSLAQTVRVAGCSAWIACPAQMQAQQKSLHLQVKHI
jgi:hypothetical protein